MHSNTDEIAIALNQFKKTLSSYKKTLAQVTEDIKDFENTLISENISIRFCMSTGKYQNYSDDEINFREGSNFHEYLIWEKIAGYNKHRLIYRVIRTIQSTTSVVIEKPLIETKGTIRVRMAEKLPIFIRGMGNKISHASGLKQNKGGQ